MKLSHRTSLALIGTAVAVGALAAVAFAASTTGMLGMAGGMMGGGMMNGGMMSGGMVGGGSCATMMASGSHPMTPDQCQAMMTNGTMDPAQCQAMTGSPACSMG